MASRTLSNVVGIIGRSMMIDGKRLLEIERRRGQAQFGYGVMGNREYAQDVGELLGELQSLQVQVRHLEDTVSGLCLELKKLSSQAVDLQNQKARPMPSLSEKEHPAPSLSELGGVYEDDFDVPDKVEHEVSTSSQENLGG